MRVMIVEDDHQIGDGLASGLRGLGFATDWFERGEQADTAMRTAPYDAIVLDLGLPGGDGLAWLGRWRARGDHVSVLILTARDAVTSRVAGLDAGADDYLVKPITLAELAARLRAVVRRAQGRPEPLWTHGDLAYDPSARAARWRGQPVDLTARESALLEVLLANPGRIVPKATILEKVYGWDEAIESNALEVYVHHLRRKIHPAIVRTVRGVGYALGDPGLGEAPPEGRC
jgi:two-component system response regulator QseB